MMIAVPKSNEDLKDNNQYLFPPPKGLNVNNNNDENGDTDEESSDDESDENSSNDSDDDDNDEESSDDDNSENNEESDTRPKKRQKVQEKKQSKLSYQQLRMYKREYLKAWLAVLRLSLSTSSLKQALQFLPQYVLQYVNQPLRFADFFMTAYSDHGDNSGNGGSSMIGMLALDGLFVLMTEYGLEYPNFYAQLYKLISPRVFYVKYRTRFFTLLTKCLLRNEMLPAHIVAAFLKRLNRCILSGPTSGALFVLALTSNLLRKHPECHCLIQRNNSNNKTGDEETMMEDMFLPDVNDPVECRALQSSLWELVVLEKHYYPAVSTLAKSIGREEETKIPLYNVIDDFTGHTYISLFEQEKKKSRKQRRHH